MKGIIEMPRDFHFYVSMVKSVIRMLAGAALIVGSIAAAGVLVIVAEILGIVEEL